MVISDVKRDPIFTQKSTHEEFVVRALAPITSFAINVCTGCRSVVV